MEAGSESEPPGSGSGPPEQKTVPAPLQVAPSGNNKVRRPRQVKSCIECRRRKLRCDRQDPCSQCRGHPRVCRYREPGTRYDPDLSDSESSGQSAKQSRLKPRGMDDGNVSRPLTLTDTIQGRLEKNLQRAGGNYIRDSSNLTDSSGTLLQQTPYGSAHTNTHTPADSIGLQGVAFQHARHVLDDGRPRAPANLTASPDIVLQRQPTNVEQGHIGRPLNPSYVPPQHFAQSHYALGPSHSVGSQGLATPAGGSRGQSHYGVDPDYIRHLTNPTHLRGEHDIAARLKLLESLLLEQASSTHHDPVLPSERPRRHFVRNQPAYRRPETPIIQKVLGTFYETREVIGTVPEASNLLDQLSALADAQRTFQREHQKALEPFVVHVESVVPIQKRMAGILPPRPACDRLVDFYFSVLETMFPIVHKPSFGREYKKYWGGNLENDAFLPRLLCILCFASRFCTGTQSHCSIHIPTACVLVRDWLDGLRKREVFDPYILQTELLLLLAQWTIGTQKGAAWAQLSYVVRMAMELGLHQDPSGLAGISEFNMECRRRLWFAIMEMDFYVSLAHNWTPVLGHKDYSCNPPRNLNNADMPADARTLPESKPLDQATDNHLQAYAAQTFPLRMQAADLLARLDPADDHGEILDVGAKLEKMLDDINKTFPRHVLGKGHKHREWRRRVLLDLHLRLPLMALYRPMVVGRPNCSPEISCGYLKCCMTVLKYLDDEPIGDHVGSPDVAALSLLFLQRALTEAACDVCWYIKQAREINFAGGLMWIPPTGSRRRNAESTQQYVWAVRGMVETVERTIDRLSSLIHQGLSSQVGDIVALLMVLVVVQPGTASEKISIIQAKLERLRTVYSQMYPVYPSLPLPSSAASLKTTDKRRNLQSIYGEPLASDRFMRAGPLEPASLTWADLLMHWESRVAET